MKENQVIISALNKYGRVPEQWELLNEIERLNSIIKEVREYIENNWISQKDADNYRFAGEELDIEISDIAILYDILDKE